MHCKNCAKDFQGKFCPSCGQPAQTERITFQYLLHEIPHSIFHVDKGILFTAKELILRPSASMQEYFSGKRINHFKPFAHVVILSTISSFLAHLVSKYVNTRYGPSTVYLEPTSLNKWIIEAGNFFEKYQAVFFFLMIPVLSLCTWMFFKKKYNFWEQLVLNTYLTAQFNFLLIAAQIIRFFKGEGVSYTPFLIIFFTYIAFVYSSFFIEGKRTSIYILKIVALTIIVVFVYITGLSFAGIMTPWWGV